MIRRRAVELGVLDIGAISFAVGLLPKGVYTKGYQVE